MTGKLKPTKGVIKVHPQAKHAYFEQHFVDSLQEEHQSSLEYMAQKFPTVKEQELYNQLGSFGLGGALARQQLSTLSGGQRVRFVFAYLLFERPYALFLDEPTNHLDLDAIEAMAEALSEFQGSVVLVSHDLYFVKRVAHPESIFVVQNGSVSLVEDIERHFKKVKI